MTTAVDLLDDLRTKGYKLQTNGAQLTVRPRLTDDLRPEVLAHKPALIELLEERSPTIADIPDKCACGSVVFYYQPDGTPLCARHSPRWVGGRDLADLAGELAPRVHLTIRHSGDEDESLDHLRELFHILDLHPGGNRVSIRIVERDGLATHFERQALASRTLRLALAICIRD